MDVEIDYDTDSEKDEDNLFGTFYFWNNWLPPHIVQCKSEVAAKPNLNRKIPSQSKTWVPPVNFATKIHTRKSKEFLNTPKQSLTRASKLPTQTSEHEEKDPNMNSSNQNTSQGLHTQPVIYEIQEKMSQEEPSTSSTGRSAMKVKGTINSKSLSLVEEWGERLQYGSCWFNIPNDVFVWDYFEPGSFGTIKIWSVGYGQVKALAETAEVNNGSCTDEAVLVINQPLHLRQLLRVEPHQWCALLETLGDGKWTLNYTALSKSTVLAKLSPVEKLWYFLCKQRHYSPALALRMRRAGVKKIPLKIIPKFIVTDIRNFSGEGIA